MLNHSYESDVRLELPVHFLENQAHIQISERFRFKTELSTSNAMLNGLFMCVGFIESGVSFTAPYKSPGNLTGDATSSTSIFVQWDALVLPNIRGILRGYRVYYEVAPGSVHGSVLRNTSVDISVTEAELFNLHKFTEYRIWVTAFTTREGELSDSIFVRTREDSKCRSFRLLCRPLYRNKI